jgi:two-component system, NtrC family, sensor kinase
VLKVISRSAFDLQTVLDTLVESAARLCEADMAAITRRIDDAYYRAGSYGFPPEFVEYAKATPVQADRHTITGRTLLEGRIVHVDDVLADPEYDFEGQQLSGNPRTFLGVPLLREGSPIGALTLTRSLVKPFTDKQIELITTFADQAVIAIENVRLFDEVQARTRDLAESLQQQTATADVLKVISRSAFNLQAVLDTLVESAARLCESDKGVIFKRDGELYRWSANFGNPPELETFAKANPFKPGRYAVTSRVALEGKTFHVADVIADPEYGASQYQKLGGYRTILCVPLLREGVPIGVFALTRSEVKPFTERQIELVQSFADQAVIAIENVRLFDEVQAKTRDLSEALTYQTGSGNILRVIASSPTDVKPVLTAIVESACELCEADDALATLRDGNELVFQAQHGTIPVVWQRQPIDREGAAGLAVIECAPVHVHDLLAAEGEQFPRAREFARTTNVRTVLCVPLLREGESIGAIVLRRTEVRPFSDKQIALLQTFADQAVIAIGNVRLFEEVQQRTRELAASLDDLRTAQDRLVQTEKLASLGQLTAGIAHEIKNPLNFVNNFAALSAELTDELNDVLKPAELAEKIRGEVDELTGLLKDNLQKVVQHGQRADSIVKNMLLHSREGSGDHRPADINALIDESLNLAYHGARAEKPNFNVTLQRNLDPAAGMLEVFPQEITRVFLNLVSNGFYAVTKRKGEDSGFDPILSATTRNLGDAVEIRIRDNGTGIPPEVKDKMFNPFFTTKPAGEGTGLGLSMSHDIIVKQHGGTIDVETQPGQFTEFRIVLPRTSNSTNKSRG